MAAKPAKWDLEVDLVAVGSGLGHTPPAIAAHDLGLRCALLEKAPKLGGLSAFGGGEIFVPANRHMAKLGLADSREEGRAYIEFLAMGYGSQPHRDKWLGTMHEAIAYYEDQAGVRFKACPGPARHYHPHSPRPERASGPARACPTTTPRMRPARRGAAATSRSSSSTGSRSAPGSRRRS